MSKNPHNAKARKTYYYRHTAKIKVAYRKWILKTKYGMTREQYDELLAKQKYCCAICSSPDPQGRGEFQVDHDHKTGQIRGLLCTNCNSGLGRFKDSPSDLRRAANYLELTSDPLLK